MSQPVAQNDMTQAAKRHRAALNGAHPETTRLQWALLALEAYWARIKELEERFETLRLDAQEAMEREPIP